MGFLSNLGASQVFGGLFGGQDAARRGARAQRRAAEAGIEEQRRQFDMIMQMLSPQVEGGDIARQRQMALLGLLGPEEQQAAYDAFTDSPGQQFMRERQQRALLRGAAATGGLGGGNVQTALQEQAAGFAAQDYNRMLGQLGALSGAGGAAASNLGQFGMQSASSIANLMGQAGAAQASGILGQQQAQSQMVGNLLSLGGMFSDRRLKKDIVKISEHRGLNLYSWVWKGTGEIGYGYMADEVQEKYPEYVQEVDGYLMVNYEALKAA